MIGFLNWLIKALAAVVVTILNLLPQSPFTWDLGSLGPLWANANYFVPFNVLAGVMGTYLVSVGVWYAARWILRLARYID